MNAPIHVGGESKARFAIEINGLKVELGGTSVLRGVSVAVGEGEVLGILGPSGSGKTTLLRALAGLVRLQSGQINIAGKDQEGVSSWSRDIGFVFQSPNALFPHLTVFENVAFPFRRGGKRLSGGDWTEAVGEILRITGLAGFAKRSLATLSGGQLQRVALARALVYRPAILLLDEPLSSLDNRLKQSLLELLIDLKAKFGGTHIYVSHDEREIRYLADRVAVLIDGRIAQVGSIADVWSRPVSVEVARLIGGWNILTLADRIGAYSDADRQEGDPCEDYTIGVPVSRTSFVLGGEQVPPDHIALEAVVIRRADTQNGAELHCVTKRGDRLVAVAPAKNIGDATTGVVVFGKKDTHAFNRYDNYK